MTCLGGMTCCEPQETSYIMDRHDPHSAAFPHQQNSVKPSIEPQSANLARGG